MPVTMTDHKVLVFWDNLTALSRLHSKGALMVTESAIARESGYLERDVHDVLNQAQLFGWVLKDMNEPAWRLRDGVVNTVRTLKYCDGCKADHSGLENRAVASVRLGNRWVYVCTTHFVSLRARIGRTVGQFIRLDY